MRGGGGRREPSPENSLVAVQNVHAPEWRADNTSCTTRGNMKQTLETHFSLSHRPSCQ